MAAATGPTVTSDVLFNSGVVYAPAAFTLGTSQTFGSLNDLSATALTISNTGGAATSTLTLGGAGNLGDGVVGSNAADLLFVGTGSSLTLTGGAGNAALNLALGQSGNFDVNGTAAISSIISGAGFGITKTGTGTLTLTGANTFSGGVSIQAGQVTLGTGGSVAALGTGTLSLGAASGGANATLSYSLGTNSTVANAINVNAGSTGTLQIQAFSGGPTFTGAVTLANNLLLSNANTAANTLTLSGGITGTGNVTVANTSVSATTISGTASNFTGTLMNASTSTGGLNVSSNLSGAVSILQNSAGSTTTLSGTDTYTGSTTINAGTLALGTTTAGSLTPGSNITFTGTSAFNYQGRTAGSTQTLGTLLGSAGDNTVTATYGTSGTTTLAIGTYTRSAGATTNFVNTGGTAGTTNLITLGNVTPNTLISPGAFSGGSSYAFYDANGFVRALNYTNDATAANTSTQTGAAMALTVNATPATQNAQYVGSAGTAGTLNTTTGSTAATVASGTFVVGQAITGTGIAAKTYVAAINGTALTLSQNASATTTGTATTPYNQISAQPTATVNTLNLSGAGASVALASGATLTTNGILRSGEGATGAISTITGGTSLTVGGTTDFVVSIPVATDFLTVTTPVNGNGVPLVKSGLGTLTLNGTVNNSGGIIDNAGPMFINGVISGAGSITVNSTTALALNAATNTFTGGILLVNGTVTTSGSSDASLGTGSITLGPSTPNSASLQERPFGGTVTNAIIVNPGTSPTTQRSLASTNGNGITFSGTQTLNNGATVTYGSGGGNVTVSGAISGTGNVTVGGIGAVRNGATFLTGSVNPTGTIIYDQNFLPTGNRAGTGLFTISGVIGSNLTGIDVNVPTTDGALVLSGTNTFFGDTTLTSGKINLQNSLALQNSVLNTVSAANSTVTFGTSATVGLNAVTLGGLSGAGNVNLNNTLTTPTAVALTIGNSNASNASTTNPNTLNPTYAGVLSNTNGAASLTKVGTNTQTFTGANTYTGATAVTGGTLALANTTGRALTATSAIAVNNGGTLLFGAANQVNVVAPITVGTTAAQTPASTTGVLSFAAGASQGTAETLTGGTAAGGPTVAGLGALTLSNTATLAFGGAGTTLVFGTFTPNGNVLNITGYTNTGAMTAGNSGTATDDRLVFSTDQSANLANFNFGAGLSAGEVALDNGFYEVTIAAVPEPSTWLAGIACLGFVSYRLVRSRRQAR